MCVVFSQLLAHREASGNPIRVGIVGAGKFGGGLIAQLSRAIGMKAVAIADIHLERIQKALDASGIGQDKRQIASTLSGMTDAIRNGKHTLTDDANLVTQCDDVDVVVEVTGVPEIGAQIAHDALQNRKHVVMVTVEADVTVGAYLRRLADKQNVVYSLVDGDQPGCIMNLIDWARALGFEIVAAGRGTVFYSADRDGTPDTAANRFGFSDETVERRSINPKMYNSFRDGSKAQIEMTAVANMTGLVPDVRGMHELSLNIEDIARVFSLKEEGGVLNRHGVVELANSVADDGKTLLPNALEMGVFVVIRTDHPYIAEDLGNHGLYSGGNGKNFLLHRPYHLVAVEAPISVALASLYGQPTGTPQLDPVADVITIAKKDLKEGEKLDGIGGYTVYGVIEHASTARAKNLLPLGLTEGARLKQSLPRGTPITYDMVELDEDSFVLKLRRMQDELRGPGPVD